MTVEEYHIAQLWSVAEASKNETGGGEGIEVLKNEPFDQLNNAPKVPLLNGDPNYTKGQFTHKKYYLENKVPGFARLLAPKGSLEIDEKAWNAFPYCRTICDVHKLSQEELSKREVVYIDISNDSLYSTEDYSADTDPRLFVSTLTGRGPLVGANWWKQERRIFTNFHRQLFCWMDKWYGLTLKDIRELEEKTRLELNEQRGQGEIRGTKADE